eukprot:scaffold9308_cov115-Cylindrotheca_fusiformis.AAC.5
MLRQIPSLQVLCLRSVGGHGCTAEDTFAPSKPKTASSDGKKVPSCASRMLQSFDSNDHNVVISRTPATGKGAARRNQANDVDLNHPWIGVWSSRDPVSRELLMEHGSPGLDVLQCFIDSLVELGRMDDSKLGCHFFEEWKANVLAKSGASSSHPPPKKKSRRDSNDIPKLGSLSLHNSVLGEETIEAMTKANMAPHLAVLDLTGIQTLTDEFLEPILKDAKNLQRLSLKNCRRLTNRTLEILGQHSSKLTSLDIGGSYNLNPQSVLEVCANLFYLRELYASGLGWTDELLQELTSMRGWTGLAVGFAPMLTAQGFKAAMLSQSNSLISLAIPFCEQMVDAALMGNLGRHLPELRALDVRGNSNLTSLTGWYDGRATLDPKPEARPLLVLARYSGISKSSIDDAKRIHPLDAMELECIMDSGGIGLGIQRVMEEAEEEQQ